MTAIEEIIRAGSKFYHVPTNILLGRFRERRIAMVRFSIMFMCRKAGYTFPVIGRAFRRDHGTVIHACKEVGPNQFGPLWGDHCQFMEFAKAITAQPDPVESVKEEIDRSLHDINAQIERLETKKELLLSFRARIEPPEIRRIIAQAEGEK